MNIDIITFCDSAHDYNGKLVIAGTFNTITANSFPVIPSEFSFVVNASFEPAEFGHHKGCFKIYKKDKPDLILVNIGMPINVGNANPGQKAYMNICGSLAGTPIPEPGTYVASFEIGALKREIELYANIVTA